MAMETPGARPRRGARRCAAESCSSTRAGCRTRSAARTCSRPTSASRRTSTSSRARFAFAHAPARLLLGRPARRHARGATRSASSSRSAARTRRARRATSTRAPRRSTSVLDDATVRPSLRASPPPGRRSVARGDRAAGRAPGASPDAGPAACPDAPDRGIRAPPEPARAGRPRPRRDWRSEARRRSRRLAGDRAAHPPGARPEAAAGKSRRPSRYPEPVSARPAHPPRCRRPRSPFDQQARDPARHRGRASTSSSTPGSALGYVWSVVEAARAVHDPLRGLQPLLQARRRSRTTTRSRC